MKSCSNCRFLSRSEAIRFVLGKDQFVEEVRVICLKKQWHRGSVKFETICEHGGIFKERAEKCVLYQIEAQVPTTA